MQFLHEHNSSQFIATSNLLKYKHNSNPILWLFKYNNKIQANWVIKFLSY